MTEKTEIARWYVGDPCYIIPDDDWSEFCDLTLTGVGGDKHEGGHIDSIIEWRGQTLTIWSNGGDGTWGFDGLKSANEATSFSVDAGIFCVIDLHALPAYKDDPSRMGILFEDEPELYVQNLVVYLNGKIDNMYVECPCWRCHEIIEIHQTHSCHYGNCDDGCDSCFECNCCEGCGNAENDCACGEEE